MIRILLVVVSMLLLMACSPKATATPAKTTPPKTVTITQAAPAPQVILPPEFPDVLQRLSAVEGKLIMVESSQKTLAQNVATSLAKSQSQVNVYNSYQYEIDTLKSDLNAIKARLSVIETKLGITP